MLRHSGSENLRINLLLRKSFNYSNEDLGWLYRVVWKNFGMENEEYRYLYLCKCISHDLVETRTLQKAFVYT